jgi:hypothetical protein
MIDIIKAITVIAIFIFNFELAQAQDPEKFPMAMALLHK